MSDRPTPVNGKRNQAWGTTNACPECGECLCFACHPQGPCVDEHHAHLSVTSGGSRDEANGQLFAAWTSVPEGGLGVAGLHLRSR
jgi:hypothetical protein